MPGTHVASRLVETDGAAERGRGGVVAVRFQCARPGRADAPVRIGYLPITDAAPLLVAHNNGLFDKAGVKAESPRCCAAGRR